MRRHRYFFNFYIIAALLLGTAMPLLHAVDNSDQGFWTSTCRGKALFVPALTADTSQEHHHCLICLAESSDDAALCSASLKHLSLARPHDSITGAPAHLPRCSSPCQHAIRAPPLPGLFS